MALRLPERSLLLLQARRPGRHHGRTRPGLHRRRSTPGTCPSWPASATRCPGKTNQVVFRADEEGVYDGQSATLSGQAYAAMRTEVEVVSPEEYEAFVKQPESRHPGRPGPRRRPDRKRRNAMSAARPELVVDGFPPPPPALGRDRHQRRPQGRRPDPDRRRARLPLHRPGRAAADAAAAGDPGEHLPHPGRLQPHALALRGDGDLLLRRCRSRSASSTTWCRCRSAPAAPRCRASARSAPGSSSPARRSSTPASSSPPRRPASTRCRRSPSSPSSPTTASTPGPRRPAWRRSASS